MFKQTKSDNEIIYNVIKAIRVQEECPFHHSFKMVHNSTKKFIIPSENNSNIIVVIHTYTIGRRVRLEKVHMVLQHRQKTNETSPTFPKCMSNRGSSTDVSIKGMFV